MATTVILEAKTKSGTGNDVLAKLKDILPDTRSYDGCISLDVYQEQDDSDTLVMVEQWESKSHYEKYLNWRIETGVFAKLAEALEGAPNIRYFDLADT